MRKLKPKQIKSTVRARRCLAGVVLMMLLATGSSAETSGVDDLGPAFTSVDSVGILLDLNNDLRRENDYLEASVNHKNDLLGLGDVPWYVDAWRSEPTRWILFVLGVWLGIYASK